MPDLAASGIRMFEQSGVAYLVTMRKDGGPLVSPLVPIVAQGRLFVVIPQASPADPDLRRHARLATHAPPRRSTPPLEVRYNSLSLGRYG